MSSKSAFPASNPAFDAVVAFAGGRARVTGPTGSGKTLALLTRAHRLARAGESSLFVAASPAVQSARSLIVRGQALRDAEISVHSWASLCALVYKTHGGQRRIIDRAVEADLLCTMLGQAKDSAIARRVTVARRAYVESWLGPGELASHAGAAGVGERWMLLHTVTEQFADLCRDRGFIDQSTVMIEATHALRTHSNEWRDRYPNIVFDDFESTSFAQYRLALTLTGLEVPGVGVPGNSNRSIVISGDLEGPTWGGPTGAPWLASADQRFQIDADFALTITSTGETSRSVEAIHVRHRALRGTAIVSELARLLEMGYESHEVAVIVSPGRAGRDLARSIHHAAARRQIPVYRSERIEDDPVAAALADAASAIISGASWPKSICALGISEQPASLNRNDSASTLLFQLWQLLSPRLLGLDHASQPATEVRRQPQRVEALRALHRETLRALDQGMSDTEAIAQARRSRYRRNGGVEIISDFDARGQRWPVVIVAGFEEGTRPPQPRPVDYFDLEILNGPDTPEQNTRHRDALVESRRRAENLLARGNRVAIAITAPEPGILASRFIEGVAQRQPSLDTTIIRPVEALSVSNNARGFWEDRKVRGSASSLDTFRNCPLEYTYKYVLNIATESGPQAMVGTITHDVLEVFYDPAFAHDRSPERLRQVFEARWSDADFDYLAQASEYRATILAMLENVAQRHLDDRPDVLHVERPFSITLGDYTLSGKIDRIDVVRDHDGATHGLSILDYKTGKWTKNAGEESLQLGVYYLAARHDPELSAVGEPVSLGLYFLKDDRLEPQRVHPRLEDDWTQVILSTLALIAEGEHRPSPEASCEYCSFGRVCPTQPEGRFVHISTSRRNQRTETKRTETQRVGP